MIKPDIEKPGRSAQLRPSRLHWSRLGEAARWLEKYRPFWQERLDRLHERLQVPDRSRRR